MGNEGGWGLVHFFFVSSVLPNMYLDGLVSFRPEMKMTDGWRNTSTEGRND